MIQAVSLDTKRLTKAQVRRISYFKVVCRSRRRESCQEAQRTRRVKEGGQESIQVLGPRGQISARHACCSLSPVSLGPSTMSAQQPSLATTIDVLRGLLPESLIKPKVGIVCGSGLSTLASSLKDTVLIDYDILPGFGRSTGTNVL